LCRELLSFESLFTWTKILLVAAYTAKYGDFFIFKSFFLMDSFTVLICKSLSDGHSRYPGKSTTKR
jgi:hypothetical protein